MPNQREGCVLSLVSNIIIFQTTNVNYLTTLHEYQQYMTIEKQSVKTSHCKFHISNKDI
jgi:hypothetical protein